MKAVSVLEHFSDHGSIHQKMKKNTASVRSYPNSAGDGILWDLDRNSEKASPVFEHPFRQTTSVQGFMCEWSCYPAGSEMGFPRYIAIELGVQHCLESPHISHSSCFQSQELMDSGQTTKNTPTALCFHHQT
ncbi:hypothetical protein TNCV_3361691 [Trichonephila clavipes]|nr:hypothetical protein TNCV_3361691 [Trichonephila clavipes]